jgi:uncharacterized membrane protein YgcG
MKQFYLFLFLIFALGINAQPYAIRNFDVTINVTEDGKMMVEEQIDVFFNEQRRGIFRTIPFKYKMNKKRYNTPLTNINVPGNTYQVSNSGPNKVIRIGDEDIFLTGPKVYTIQYTVDEAIVGYDDGEEIYWNLTGNEWDVPINSASFEINLPKNVEIDPNNLKTFTGKFGDTNTSAVISQNSSRSIEGQIKSPLGIGEGLTIAVMLPKAYFKGIPRFTELPDTGLKKETNRPWYLGIPLLLWALFHTFWKNFRDRLKSKSEVFPQTYPPSGMTSAHVGGYIDHRVNNRDIISLIPYWATEGYIKVMGMEDGDMVLIRNSDLPHDYPQYEIDFFNKIFSGGDSIAFSDAKHKFGIDFIKAKNALAKEIENAGYYDPTYIKYFKSWPWPILCTLVVVLGILSIVFYQSVIIGVGLIVLGIGLFFYMFVTAPLSEYGQEIHDQIKGLELFMKKNDGDEIKEVLDKDPDYFGKMLPFAVAFGLDKQWLQTFETIYDTAPSWYYINNYHARPTFSNFSQNFEVKEITRAFSTPPVSSSGSSGFSSGGGFSGGGFGGGGGGSW